MGLEGEAGLTALAAELTEKGVPPSVAAHWAGWYGVRARDLARQAYGGPGEAADAEAAAPLDDELPHRMVEVDVAVEEEMARTLRDVMGRRIPLLLRARDQGLGVAPRIAARMARHLDWPEARVREEIDRYRAIVDESRRFRRAT